MGRNGLPTRFGQTKPLGHGKFGPAFIRECVVGYMLSSLNGPTGVGGLNYSWPYVFCGPM
jgi:hypothetical protein